MQDRFDDQGGHRWRRFAALLVSDGTTDPVAVSGIRSATLS
ncbi:hypothetical protein OG989_05915 [Micromonospora sp. NBC_01740]|nr:hypothetical protein OG989_05915 [Micromonospora sp. NBC_01740]